MKSKQFLEEIRRAPGLKRAVLTKITVEGGEATFHLITDLTYSREDVAYAESVCKRYAEGLRATAHVIKSVPSEEGVRRALTDTMRREFPAFAAFVTPDDVRVTLTEAGGTFSIGVGAEAGDKGREDGILDALTAMLSRNFCGVFAGEFRIVKRDMGEIEHAALPPEERILAPRTFPIEHYSPIDDAKCRTALYISDLDGEMQGVTVCGAITYLEERETKKGKPYFSVTIADATGTLRGAYFSKKATVERIRALEKGQSVCLTGDNELYGGGLSFRIKSIDLGTPPEGFVPEDRPSRPVPAQYTAVFPVPEEDLVQADLFGVKPLPEEFVSRDFVVFDLETTGLSRGGVMDRIIEVGAVKISGGKICERFSTFVACPVKIPEEIVELTGITDDMLVGAPPVGVVIADFFRFTAGCSLVAHNASFDTKFIRYYGEEEGYRFDRRAYDTVAFAQEMLLLKDYKLNTVAEHFGFTFRHHRAFEDAFVTAKIFIELVRMRGRLPD